MVIDKKTFLALFFIQCLGTLVLADLLAYWRGSGCVNVEGLKSTITTGNIHSFLDSILWTCKKKWVTPILCKKDFFYLDLIFRG